MMKSRLCKITDPKLIKLANSETTNQSEKKIYFIYRIIFEEIFIFFFYSLKYKFYYIKIVAPNKFGFMYLFFSKLFFIFIIF